MSNISTEGASSPETIYVPASRTKALTRAVLWGVCVGVMVSIARPVFANLNFEASAVSSRIVDISIAIVASPLWIGAFYCLYKSVRWLLFVVWPAKIGVYASCDALILKLGSFGDWRFDAGRIETKYPFESEDEEDGGEYESFLSEEQQRATLLPKIRHPESPEPIERTIQRYVDVSELELAVCLRPIVDEWRSASLCHTSNHGQG